MFDETHKGDVSKLYTKDDNDNVSSKSATEVTVMIYNTATLKSAHLLKATDNIDDEKEEPQEEHDDHDQAKMFGNMKEDEKKIAPLDALFPKIRVSSNDESPYQEDEQDESPYQVDVQDETYQENGSHAKNVMTMALYHPQDCQDQTTSPALTMMREQVDDKDQTEVKMAPFATEGAEGITKCPSTWPAHFAAVTTAALHSFLHQQGQAAVHLPNRSCLVHTLL
jgi:hypothetical protein